MDKKKYSSTLAQAIWQTNYSRIIALGLLISNMVLAYAIVSADISEKTIVVPPGFDTPFAVKGNDVSPEYIQQMGRYLSQLLLTYQKKNARAQFDTVLRYAHPAVYGDLRTRFRMEVDRIGRNDISSVFHILSIHSRKDKAIIYGELTGFIGGHQVSKREKTYELNFQYGGTLQITGFNELQKDSVGGYVRTEQEDDVILDMPAASVNKGDDDEK